MQSDRENKVIYDFSSSPITFDFVNFLANARLALAAAGKDPQFHLTLLADQWRNLTPREQQYGLEERLWRLHNLILPIASITPAITSLWLSYKARDRSDLLNESADFISNDQNYLIRSLMDTFRHTGYEPHLFASPKIAIEMAKRIIGGSKKSAVLSLRNSNFEQSRDTPMQVFRAVAEELTGRGFSVFVIPAQESGPSHYAENSPLKFIHQASMNIPLRLALHEVADVSICTTSGPTSLLSLAVSKPNLVICYPIREGVRIASPEYFQAHGYRIGASQPLPWTPENQIWLWEESVAATEICDAAGSLMFR